MNDKLRVSLEKSLNQIVNLLSSMELKLRNIESKLNTDDGKKKKEVLNG